MIVQSLVKPYRATVKRERTRRIWWLHEHDRPELYAAIKPLPRFIAVPWTSKHWIFAFATQPVVIAATACAIASDSAILFGILQSTIHETWLREGPSKGNDLAGRPQYSISNGFETFPFPASLQDLAGAKRASALTPDLRAVGDAADDLVKTRGALLREMGLAPIDLYNRLQAMEDRSKEIVLLRRVHLALDHAVLHAYGWNDLKATYVQVETRYGRRVLLPDVVRREIIDRLVEANKLQFLKQTTGDESTRTGKPRTKTAKVRLGEPSLLDLLDV